MCYHLMYYRLCRVFRGGGDFTLRLGLDGDSEHSSGVLRTDGEAFPFEDPGYGKRFGDAFTEECIPQGFKVL